MRIFINGIGLISPQETRDNDSFLTDIIELDQGYFPICEPPYKEFIKPRDLRRMSKIIRNGIIAAKIAMADAELLNPDAIITGTGLGCVVDTEKFLINMIENKETMLTPTAFIQSTHNTLGGSIAIGLGCHNYNMTYVHRGFSFESAMMDGQLMLQANEVNNVLIGGFDEMTDNHFKLVKTTDRYHLESGAVAGQSSGFFVLDQEKSENTYSELLELELIYNPTDATKTISEKIQSIINTHHIDLSKTAIIMGYNGIEKETKLYDKVKEEFFSNSPIAHYKHLCGEFYTASAFAFWTANQILKKQNIPESVSYENTSKVNDIEHVLVFNQFCEKEYSLILLGKC